MTSLENLTKEAVKQWNVFHRSLLLLVFESTDKLAVMLVDAVVQEGLEVASEV